MPAWDPCLDVLKGELRSGLAPRRQALFDLFAPLAASPLTRREEGEKMAIDLAGACRRSEPLLDPASELRRMRVPIYLFHGRGDRLVPYTESLRFKQRLSGGLAASVTVTGLFAHSADHRPSSVPARLREGLIFFRALQRMLDSVGLRARVGRTDERTVHSGGTPIAVGREGACRAQFLVAHDGLTRRHRRNRHRPGYARALAHPRATLEDQGRCSTLPASG